MNDSFEHILLDLNDNLGVRDKITIGDILKSMGDKSFLIAIIIFSLPNFIVLPPGLSAVFGAPALCLSLQILFGCKTMWLPDFLLNRTITGKTLSTLCNGTKKYARFIDRVAKPRAEFIISDTLNQIFMVILSVIICLPIIFGNTLPAIAISLFALSSIRRDGFIFLVGLGVMVIALIVITAVVTAAITGTGLAINYVKGLL